MAHAPYLKVQANEISFSRIVSLSLSFSLYSPFSSPLVFVLTRLSAPHPTFRPVVCEPLPPVMRTPERTPSNISSQTRSWRRTVAHAVALAQWAVELDAKNTDPTGALAAYTESVRLLRSILARVERHGAHSEASQLAIIVRRLCHRPLSIPSRIERFALAERRLC